MTTILYVEDDELVRESFAEALATTGCQIVAVEGVASARQALRDTAIDLLMTDLNLADGSGHELAREALQQKPTLPVIVCSGHDASELVRSLGPTAHALRKPVTLAEIRALLDRITRAS